MWSIGADRVPGNENPNRKCIVDMKSCCIGAASRVYLMRKVLKSLLSCSKGRFKLVADFVHRNNEAYKKGEGHVVYNSKTGETFTYH